MALTLRMAPPGTQSVSGAFSRRSELGAPTTGRWRSSRAVSTGGRRDAENDTVRSGAADIAEQPQPANTAQRAPAGQQAAAIGTGADTLDEGEPPLTR